MFAGFEVLRFDRLLRRLNALGDHARLDRNTFFHAQTLQQVRHPLFREDAHQVIFERQVEARRSWIALAAGSSAQLVIDAASFMPLGAKDVQAARGNHFAVLNVGLLLVAVEGLVPLVGRHYIFVAAVIPDGHVGVVDAGLHFALRRA